MKMAKSRAWTEDEVQQAIDEMKRMPSLWEEIEHIERTSADFTETDTDRRSLALALPCWSARRWNGLCQPPTWSRF